MHWDFILMLLLLAVAVPLLGWHRIRELMRAPETSKSDRIRLYASTILSQWLAVGFILWRTRAHAISDAQLGMAIPNVLLTAATSIALAALILANQLFSLRQLSVHPEAAEGALAQIALRIFPQGGSERLIFVAVVATVAVCEEVIYRGFVQWALQDWARGMLLAGILGSAALFGLGHVYQGWRGFTTTCIVGILFSVSRSWTGSLLPGIFAHFIADLTVGLFSPSRLRAASGNRLSVEIPQGRDLGT